jgi:D-alanyl-lipoteichoic acid acyltransferase DltB (MBOAT superfamily)
LPLILTSIIVNYFIGTYLNNSFNSPRRTRKTFLISGIVFNLGLLGFFKYNNFLISGINITTGTGLDFLNLTLPLGISFFTFQHIAFLVDAYKEKIDRYDFLSFAVFVSFFPQLIAGPIVHHKEMMPQFENPKNSHANYRNIGIGLFIFSSDYLKKLLWLICLLYGLLRDLTLLQS